MDPPLQRQTESRTRTVFPIGWDSPNSDRDNIISFLRISADFMSGILERLSSRSNYVKLDGQLFKLAEFRVNTKVAVSLGVCGYLERPLGSQSSHHVVEPWCPDKC